jgi:D-inositol-3-phosphate glycosyltransferase
MRIAMVSEHASPLAPLGSPDAGGQNVHVGALAEALTRRGHTVVVHTRRDDPTQPRTVRTTRGFTVHHVDAGPPIPIPKDELPRWLGDFADDLRTEWQRNRPDLIHAHFWMSGLVSLDAGRPLGIPVIETFHALGSVKRRYQGADDTSPPERIGAETRLLRLADHVIATCHDEVVELRRLWAGNPSVSVVPCGVDLDLFRPDGPVAPGTGAGPRILTVGRLVARKGIGDAIAALSRLPDAELLIAGGPPPSGLDRDADVARIRSEAAANGVEDRVRIVGRVDRCDLPALIRSAIAVVAVPWYEPFGIVPLEAMACGIPAVVSAVGGLRESVVDGRTGLHVPPRQPERLAAALRSLVERPDLAKELGRAGAARVRHRYSWSHVAAATERVYLKVVARGARPARPQRIGMAG